MFVFFFIFFVVIAIIAALSEIFRPLSAKERNQRAGRQSAYSRKRSEQRIRNRMYYIQNNSGNHSSSSQRSRHNEVVTARRNYATLTLSSTISLQKTLDMTTVSNATAATATTTDGKNAATPLLTTTTIPAPTTIPTIIATGNKATK